MTTTDILLKNYPEKEFALRINDALAKSLLMDYSSIKSDAAKISSWAEGKTTADISEALRGEGSSPVSSIAKAAKEDEFWLYTKFFGIGLIKLMEITGTEATADAMEGWVKDDMGKASQKVSALRCASRVRVFFVVFCAVVWMHLYLHPLQKMKKFGNL